MEFIRHTGTNNCLWIQTKKLSKEYNIDDFIKSYNKDVNSVEEKNKILER